MNYNINTEQNSHIKLRANKNTSSPKHKTTLKIRINVYSDKFSGCSAGIELSAGVDVDKSNCPSA